MRSTKHQPDKLIGIEMNLAPIVLFVFNRPEHTRKTIESLQNNSLAAKSELYVFADGARDKSDIDKVNAVQAIIDGVAGFKSISVIRRPQNFGLAKSVIEGVFEVIAKYGSAIMVEDDLQFSPFFLDYMNEALIRYKDDPRIFSIGGYSPSLVMPDGYSDDSYLSYRCCTWGWATWLDRWNKVDWDVADFDEFINNPDAVRQFNRGGDDMSQILKLQMTGKVNSWGIRWDYAHFKNDTYCFRPAYSIVGNTGNDGSGVHCGATDKFDVKLNTKPDFNFPAPGKLQLNLEINNKFATFYDGRQRYLAPATPVAKRIRLFKKFLNWLR